MTADHREFDSIEGNEPIVFHWIKIGFVNICALFNNSE